MSIASRSISGTRPIRTPLSTSVRALAALNRDGLVAGIGLSNVTVGQIEEARQITAAAAPRILASRGSSDSRIAATMLGAESYARGGEAYRSPFRPGGHDHLRPRRALELPGG